MTSITVNSPARLAAAMILRETGSWPLAAKETGLSERYCRQINEDMRTKGEDGQPDGKGFHSINFSYKWPMVYLESELRKAKIRAARVRMNHIDMNMVIDEPKPVFGVDSVTTR